MKKRLVVLSGAGISAESGLKTFRDSDGLWENYNVYEVATPEAWYKDKATVLSFYNARRRQIEQAQPNDAHLGCAELEKGFHVNVVTQNIDDLHERAGSTRICHLHGLITQARPENRDETVLDIAYQDINLGDTHNGSQLRPHVVWFGEAVPKLEEAAGIIAQAHILVVVGTALTVYPAASLVHYYQGENPVYLIDPNPVDLKGDFRVVHIAKNASEGMKDLLHELQA